MRDSVSTEKIGEHDTRSIYVFREGFSLYDLSLQIAVKTETLPLFEFMQGDEVLTAQCYNAPHLTSDGSAFLVCPCILLPLRADK